MMTSSMLLDAIVFLSTSADRRAILSAIKKSGGKHIAHGDKYIVCQLHDPKILAGISGIQWVARAKKTTNKFSEVTGAIVHAGTGSIRAGEKFLVRVIQNAKTDYVARDLEFASAGSLVEKLAGINAFPARNELEADYVISAIIDKFAYVCVRGRT
jgi:hypothetical protein